MAQGAESQLDKLLSSEFLITQKENLVENTLVGERFPSNERSHVMVSQTII